MEYKVINKDHYNIHLINTDRFKTIKFRVILKQPIKKENIVKRNLLMDVLTSSCNNYKSRRDLVLKTQELYGVNIHTRGYRLGNTDMVNIYMTLLNPKYTEDNMLDESLKLLSNVIFDPYVENDKFMDEPFNIAYKDNKECITALKDNKDRYAIIRMLANMGEDEVYSYNEYGDLESLNNVNTENLYDYYKELLDKAEVDIYVIGNIDENKIIELLDKYMYFNNNPKCDNNKVILHNSFRDEPQVIKERDNNNQSNLVIGLKLDNLDKFELNYVLTIYNIMLGSSGESKFFRNIREKHSICYYISSSVNKLDNLMFIKSGISKENFDKILGLIKNEMQDMIDGEFTDEDITKAKEAYLTFLNEIYDNDDAIIDTYIAHEMLDIDEIDLRKKKIVSVTREQIMEVGKKIKMDTIYLLEGDKNE